MRIRILAEDIKTSDFSDTLNCAISKAVKRKLGQDTYVNTGVKTTYVSLKGKSEVRYSIPDDAHKLMMKMFKHTYPTRFSHIKIEDALKPFDFTMTLEK